MVSVAIFVAFKAGRISGQMENHALDLERLKQKIESLLWKLLEEIPGNAQLPEVNHFIETTIFPGESMEQQILALNAFYQSLLNHGIYSSYFLEFLNYLN